MGQFLATGLATGLTVSKTEMASAKLDVDALSREMENHLHFRAALYQPQDQGEYWDFHLKDDIFHTELIPFLEKFYPLIYHQDEHNDFRGALAALKASDPTHWTALAEEKEYAAFQSDPYGMPDYLSLPFGKHLRVSYDCIMLSAEGKIGMEEHGRQFRFFQYCIARTFAEFSLAGAVRVYITG